MELQKTFKYCIFNAGKASPLAVLPLRDTEQREHGKHKPKFYASVWPAGRKHVREVTYWHCHWLPGCCCLSAGLFCSRCKPGGTAPGTRRPWRGAEEASGRRAEAPELWETSRREAQAGVKHSHGTTSAKLVHDRHNYSWFHQWHTQGGQDYRSPRWHSSYSFWCHIQALSLFYFILK